MKASLSFEPKKGNLKIDLPSSKSIANRLLIMQTLSGNLLKLEGLPPAEDTKLLQAALQSNSLEKNVGMAGTAYRFLTAFYAIQQHTETVLDGASRMHKRPIKILVDVLQELGANINYLKNEGFPPLKIYGQQLKGGSLSIDGSISSQYISAILLIAPYLQENLQLSLTGRIVSLPYIDLTIELMKLAGIQVDRKNNQINVEKGSYHADETLKVEADWSSAAFFYQFVALSGISIELQQLHLKSLQGDRKTALHFEKLGVQSTQTVNGLLLSKVEIKSKKEVEFNLIDCPDLIPAIAVTASQLFQKTSIKGATTLRIKESNRVDALQKELAKINVKLIEQGEDIFEIYSGTTTIKSVVFETYNDHRIAMCLSPLVTIISNVEIVNPEVVNKSFPNYWKQLERLGVEFS